MKKKNEFQKAELFGQFGRGFPEASSPRKKRKGERSRLSQIK